MYALARQHSKPNGLTISQICRSLSLSRTGYYRAVQDRPDADEPDELELRDQIQRIAMEWPRYGYRRITAELNRQGVAVNHKKVLRLMRRDNLLCLRKRLFVRTTQSDPAFAGYPNLTAGLQVTGLDQLWVSDITYIRLAFDFVYLAVILDVFSRKCIGWALKRHLDTSLTLSALRMALARRKPGPGLIHHSDQGVQYASQEYTNLLKENGIRISMSRRGNPYDNAYAESFMKTLKYEEVYLFEYKDLEEASCRLPQFIEELYNKRRLHSALGYLPPEEFEQLHRSCGANTLGVS